MKKEFLIKSLNMGAAEALTLEKAEDRVEFEALAACAPENAFCGLNCPDNCVEFCPQVV